MPDFPHRTTKQPPTSPISSKYEDNGCRVLEIRGYLTKLEEQSAQSLELTKQLVETLDSKVDRLIDVISGKDQIPVDSLRWIILAFLIYFLGKEFGIDAVKKLIGL